MNSGWNGKEKVECEKRGIPCKEEFGLETLVGQETSIDDPFMPADFCLLCSSFRRPSVRNHTDAVQCLTNRRTINSSRAVQASPRVRAYDVVPHAFSLTCVTSAHDAAAPRKIFFSLDESPKSGCAVASASERRGTARNKRAAWGKDGRRKWLRVDGRLTGSQEHSKAGLLDNQGALSDPDTLCIKHNAMYSRLAPEAR